MTTSQKPHSTRAAMGAILSMLLLAVSAAAQTVAPPPVFQGLDNTGIAIAGGRLCTYVSGTTTPATTYTSSALSVANAIPPTGLQLDGAGRANVFLVSGQSYKFILRSASSTDCSTGTLIWSQDGVSAIPSSSNNLDVLGTAGEAITAGQAVYLSDGSGAKNAGQWYKADSANAYSSSTPQVGMAPNAITSGVAGTIRLAGQVTGLSALVVGTPYYVGTSGAVTATAPTNRRVLGAADSTTSVILSGNPAPFAAGWTVATSTSTGTQNDFAPGLLGSTVLRMNNGTAATITGVAGGYDGQEIEILAVGAGTVALSNQAGGSSATNRIITGATATLTLPATRGRARLRYDGTTARWRVLNPGVTWYEEGTWTPVIGGSGGTSGQTYATQAGSYVKVGTQVTATAFVQLSVKGTITTSVQIQGLPYVASQYAACAMQWENLASSEVWVGGELDAAAGVIQVNGITAASATSRTALLTADIANNTDFFVSCTYTTAQ